MYIDEKMKMHNPTQKNAQRTRDLKTKPMPASARLIV